MWTGRWNVRRARRSAALALVVATVASTPAPSAADAGDAEGGLAFEVPAELSPVNASEAIREAAPASRKTRPSAPTEPPVDTWLGAWASVSTAEYSSCPGIEHGHQDSFTLAVSVHRSKGLVATETPEQGTARQLAARIERRDDEWVLALRDKGGENGMDLRPRKGRLEGQRVTVRKAGKKSSCAVVWAVSARRSE